MRSQEFLAKNKIDVAETVDARKTAMSRKEALKLAAEADEILASKGKKIVRLDLRKDKPPPEAILAVMLGPTGNLRAPTLKRGRTLLVGFDEGTYKEALGPL